MVAILNLLNLKMVLSINFMVPEGCPMIDQTLKDGIEMLLTEEI